MGGIRSLTCGDSCVGGVGGGRCHGRHTVVMVAIVVMIVMIMVVVAFVTVPIDLGQDLSYVAAIRLL